MFSLARQNWNFQTLFILFSLPARFLNRVSSMIRLFLGIQEEQLSTELVAKSQLSTRSQVSLNFSATSSFADRTVRYKVKLRLRLRNSKNIALLSIRFLVMAQPP